MKRICSWILTIALVLGLCACGQSAEAQWQEQYDLGVRYLSEGNYEEAIIAFTAAIDIDAKRPEGYTGRGDAYALSGDTADNLSAALADYEAALALDETLADAWLGLADVYIRQGDYDKALEILREALEKTGNDQSIADKLAEMESGSFTDSSGNVRRMNSYDSDGNLIWYHTYTYGVQEKLALVASYDTFGNETSHVELSYDEEGRYLIYYGYDPDYGTLCSVEYRYDEDGNEIEAFWYDYTGEKTNYYLSFYDEQGEKIRSESYGPNGEKWGYYTYEYDGGNVVRENHYSSDGELYEYILFEYDSDNHQIQYSFYSANGSPGTHHINYYDDAGNYLGYDEYDGEGNLIFSTVTE